jgi:L-asparaginase
VLTHGTDTIIQTAKKLKSIPDKVIVLTGAMAPARFKYSDAAFNIGCAIAAVQTLKPGVHIAINGRIFEPDKVRKNLDRNWFEDV